MSIYALHRRTDPFGPDADRFRPERWATLRPIWTSCPSAAGRAIVRRSSLPGARLGMCLRGWRGGFRGWSVGIRWGSLWRR